MFRSNHPAFSKTFAVYAGAVICFGGLIFAGIRMMSGRFQDSIPGLFGALFGAAVLGWEPVGLDLQRSDVHPMEEAQGFRALLNLEEPKYSIEQIAARTGKSPAYVTARLKLTELTQNVVDAFYREEIGVGHALLLAKLQPEQQEKALSACFKEEWSGGGRKPKPILLPVRSLQFWIESNILLVLELAPFDKRDAELVPAAGSCVTCPKRTGRNKLLFAELGKQDACTDPTCYHAKVDAHVAKTLAAKPKLVQITTSYGQQQEGSAALPRNKYVEIYAGKPNTKDGKVPPEFKTCRYTAEAIVSEGIDKGELRKVCTQHDCPVHHPKKKNRQSMLPTKRSRIRSGANRPSATSSASERWRPSPQRFRCGC